MSGRCWLLQPPHTSRVPPASRAACQVISWVGSTHPSADCSSEQSQRRAGFRQRSQPWRVRKRQPRDVADTSLKSKDLSWLRVCCVKVQKDTFCIIPKSRNGLILACVPSRTLNSYGDSFGGVLLRNHSERLSVH